MQSFVLHVFPCLKIINQTMWSAAKNCYSMPPSGWKTLGTTNLAATQDDLGDEVQICVLCCQEHTLLCGLY